MTGSASASAARTDFAAAAAILASRRRSSMLSFFGEARGKSMDGAGKSFLSAAASAATRLRVLSRVRALFLDGCEY